jgi:Zn-dependent protease
MGWVSPLACLAIGVWLYGWVAGPVTGILLLASLLMHEVGHMSMAKALGVPVHEFGLCLKGAYTRRAYARRRRDEILISAAGPMMNLLLALPCLLLPHIGREIALSNLLLCGVNLLPLPASDGLRIWRSLVPAGSAVQVAAPSTANG